MEIGLLLVKEKLKKERRKACLSAERKEKRQGVGSLNVGTMTGKAKELIDMMSGEKGGYYVCSGQEVEK